MRKKSLLHFKPSMFALSPRVAGRMLLLGLSPFMMSVTESAIQVVFNVNLKAYSGGNSDYTAALTIMLSANRMVCMPLNGLGTGVQPLVSYNYGAGNSDRNSYGRRTVRQHKRVAAVHSRSAGLRVSVRG